MSYTEPDEPDDTERRGFILGALAAVPVIGGGAELLARGFRLLEHRPQRFQIPARAAIGIDGDRRFPFDKAAEAASDRQQRQPRR